MISNESYKNSNDVRIVEYNGKQLILIGTAHISKQSADLVEEVIVSEKPDIVSVELDKQRYESLSNQKRWENLDLKSIIKEKQLSTLIINILLSSYQKKLGDKLGVNPGVELLRATTVAKDNNIPIELCDRDVRITLKRAWRIMSFWQKMKFMAVGLASIFEHEEISEEQLEELKNKDVLSELMKELGKAMPVLKSVLIDERDSYLAKKIKETNGNKIVAVVGAGHLEGIIKKINEDENINLSEIEFIPKTSNLAKIIGWAIPIIIIGSIFYIGFDQGFGEAGNNAIFWILANGIPSALGALVAYGHPYAILSVFFAAPITSLTPLIGAGYVAAFVQAYFKPPVVLEIQNVSEDINKPKLWWQNKLLRILLVFILSGLGSVLGTYVGAYKIISSLF
ncbi:MAG: TraB/GumN family protein [Ignavibacteriales bacterium]|nr:TraB/GumN family protein [Ignavibacteriales bacterium]MCB9209927.1 TraB/GumN family protein [Ignavibacteriales bacterium]MCB9219358.1 TraB/GumN family protein [Ignavibacteriales bacterium]MCB9260245.1 TraB/GumN family protein [Ignavibacteriales bacterium]